LKFGVYIEYLFVEIRCLYRIFVCWNSVFI